MKIRTFKRLENNVYRVSIYTEDWSEGDQGLMERFGEPEIDLGGTITDGSYAFTMDNDLKRVKTESPFTAAFDERDYPDEAQDMAELWAEVIEDRIEAAIATLRLESDGFTRESVTEV